MRGDLVLQIRDLHLGRDGRVILRGVNLNVQEGEIHGLLGRNGSGKSSLAYALMGCGGYAPSRGGILFRGAEITSLSITERAELGITLAWQEPARFEGLKVRDYLSLGMKNPSQERMEEALTAVALSPVAYLGRAVDDTLSGGERKRIELAAVYAMRPRLAILNEPDSGIDVLSLQDISRLIQGMAKEGTTLLLITHRDETIGVADTASLMCEGEIVRTGGPKEVRRHYAKRCRSCEVAEIVERVGDYERF